ncbi:hypothetical protein [Marinoscillum furvescens]|uniref:hypothetical protein n=1 Tax=Marinoscillum furvescens TaxID=1026 RepID=UPI001C876FFD|nr:hypothetical protein [Marinoscillum furvescens]
MKYTVFLACFLFGMLSHAQQTDMLEVGSPKFVQLTDQLPENLTSERSIVIVSVPSVKQGRFEMRGDWKKLARTAHKTLRKIGVDPIAYLYKDDVNAGPEVQDAYKRLFDQRMVQNLIYLKQEGDEYTGTYHLTVTPFDKEEYVKNGQQGWKESDQSLSTVMLRLGRQVLRQEIERSNFIIPEGPEFLGDLVAFSGTRLQNYPTRIQSLTLAVVPFEKIPVRDDVDPELNADINAYNQEVERKNARLEEILTKHYPYKWELVEETDSDALYEQGYQYALLRLSSTGRSVKNILNYPTSAAETHYMTHTYNLEHESDLVQIPVNASVTKYYIKQTALKDLHVGKVWDADATWEQALQNFLFNLWQELEQ